MRAAIPRAFGAVVRILYSPAKGKKKRPSDDGRDIRRWRRYPHSTPDKRACRSSSGVCEPRAYGAVVRILYSPARTKKAPHFCGASFWQGNRDSNPNIQSQSLLCCRYTIPLCYNGLYFITQYSVCQVLFLIFIDICLKKV